ncbi:hypothetical protein [Candidatus Endomicrobiellum trichonymphae]|uniref:hypothetical protein n=1 Tax=Endomicrobium trichonymphae TaxID=1408204 RepID=UPI0003212E7D|nr:hypothetical protein [Candidatus Endomicrobium trichonymphae]
MKKAFVVLLMASFLVSGCGKPGNKVVLSSDLVTDLKNKIDEIEQKVSNIGQLQTSQAKTIY